uniref:Uncharacterized protein n=1 Tax=Anguilla anguilla TaxID=7936 RepID=A0A0E9SRX9_ANGAN
MKSYILASLFGMTFTIIEICRQQTRSVNEK